MSHYIDYQKSTNPPEQKEDNLYAADDREASEESHGAPNYSKLSFRVDLLVSFDVVKRGRVKEDLNQVQS